MWRASDSHRASAAQLGHRVIDNKAVGTAHVAIVASLRDLEQAPSAALTRRPRLGRSQQAWSN